ncbi:EAL domain-containing protein [uncultured Thiodictyon sp.]|uniref:EAL domain-containing response regulator n=1 Tax=uncultured Thiodictyon sp. TaxID=1846217 RepID=UPI0025E35321|nr:EAL domain-containing protein [uncultured Thiodictyon sp.]
MNGDSETGQAAAGGPGAPRVIVVHDSAMRALLTEHILKTAGCVVQTLTDTCELVELMGSFQPDLILAPAPIPATSGLELVAVARGPGTVRLVPLLVCDVDHRRQPRTATPGAGAVADGASPLRPESLVGAVTQRIACMPAINAPVPAADHLDPDTGLARRRHFMRSLARVIAGPDGIEPGHGLLVVALDGVTQLNARWGTGAADLAADHIGGLIGAHLGQADLATRLDDYRHALLVHRGDAQALVKVAEALRCLIADSPFQVDGHPVIICVSIGIGRLRPDAGDVVTMIKRAERACAEAAAGGGNRVVVDDPTVAAAPDVAHERLLTQLIERALVASDPTGGFEIFYQPMVAIGHHGLCHVEVMLRLDAGDGTLIEAADFLPLAERAGRSNAIDRWTMLHALGVLAQQGAVQPRLRLFIRQHLESLMDAGALAWLRAQIVSNALIERCPIVDLHLQDLLRHRHCAGAVIAALRKIGIQVCLAGVDETAVALELVNELKPPFVRLAPGVLQQLKADRFNQLVQRLNRGQAQVIASGVDSAALVAPVWASGVGYAQGAVIYAPRPELLFDWDELVTE